ncbi:acyl-CoA N-acyltransferase [Nemania sp. FL0031]|nr:acyl-CoA N-acyltransferase [Nemania sp. FL0031]
MDVYRSKQLRYLPIGDVKHEQFFAELMQETGTLNFDTSLPTGFTMAQVDAATKVMATRKLMAMYICRSSGHGDLQPVGAVSLSKPEDRHTQHGNASLSLVIRQQDRRRGYGKEAIAWALDWAFDFARLHRVEIAYFDWNPGAGRLYESLGFHKEGVPNSLEA